MIRFYKLYKMSRNVVSIFLSVILYCKINFKASIKSLLKEYLPPKFEYIINIRLSDLQTTLYDLYLKGQGNDQQQNLSTLKKDFKSVKLFADYQLLQKIWT